MTRFLHQELREFKLISKGARTTQRDGKHTHKQYDGRRTRSSTKWPPVGVRDSVLRRVFRCAVLVCNPHATARAPAHRTSSAAAATNSPPLSNASGDAQRAVTSSDLCALGRVPTVRRSSKSPSFKLRGHTEAVSSQHARCKMMMPFLSGSAAVCVVVHALALRQRHRVRSTCAATGRHALSGTWELPVAGEVMSLHTVRAAGACADYSPTTRRPATHHPTGN